MYQLWTPRYNQGVGTLYLIPIEMPMGPLPNISPISMMEVTLSSTSTLKICTFRRVVETRAIRIAESRGIPPIRFRYGRVHPTEHTNSNATSNSSSKLLNGIVRNSRHKRPSHKRQAFRCTPLHPSVQSKRHQ